VSIFVSAARGALTRKTKAGKRFTYLRLVLRELDFNSQHIRGLWRNKPEEERPAQA
jgi:hypothetical protein